MSHNDSKHGYVPPIPTYEEAVSDRPHSSQPFQGSQEISDDAERQGLLPANTRAGGGEVTRDGRRYQSVVENARSSEDSIDFLSAEEDVHDDGELRHDVEQMEVMEAGGPSRAQSRSRLMLLPGLSKRIAGITESLSAFRLPTVRLPFLSPLLPYWDLPHWLENMPLPSWTIIGRVAILFAVLIFAYGLVVMRVLTWKVIPPGQQFVPESVRNFVQSSVDPDIIKSYLYEVSFDDHVAGTKGDYFLAEWILGLFQDAGLDDVHYDDFEVYLNYPRADGRRVAIVSPPELAWEAMLEEDPIEGKEEQHQVPVFHGHSKSGNVTGPLVYANYGAREDFEYLKSQGIDVTGSIVLVKYYGTQGDRALKIKAAELAGAAGCLIYSDPKDDGFLKGKVWPDGPWRTSDSVQRGGVSLMSWTVGDVLTPGWASLPDADRVSVEEAQGLVNIPSLPLAWRDAQILLRSLSKTGIQVPENWIGGVTDLDGWWTGNVSASAPLVNLMNLQDENEKQPIRNVIGRIEGVEDPAKVIVAGNHRDSWAYGAVDPGSGTAVMLEIVRIFGDLVAHGWRPRRTIVFASWDAEEYNLIGSTEHVENSIDALRADGVAYLNVDVAVSGDGFRAQGSPVFETVLEQALQRVNDPRGNSTSLFDAWNATSSRLTGLGAGSDYVAFQDLAGCASLDIGFEGAPYAYPYHSGYENFAWMEKFGDPGFVYHAALAQVWGLLILELADEPLLPFDMEAYAREAVRYVSDLDAQVAASSTPRDIETVQVKLNTKALSDAAQLFLQTSTEFVGFNEQWVTDVERHGMIETRELMALRISHNARASNFDTHLLDLPLPKEGREGGVPGRTQFKHVIYGPQKWSGYDEEVFPAIRDAMEDGDWAAAQQQLDIVAKVLNHAAWKLVH